MPLLLITIFITIPFHCLATYCIALQYGWGAAILAEGIYWAMSIGVAAGAKD